MRRPTDAIRLVSTPSHPLDTRKQAYEGPFAIISRRALSHACSSRHAGASWSAAVSGTRYQSSASASTSTSSTSATNDYNHDGADYRRAQPFWWRRRGRPEEVHRKPANSPRTLDPKGKGRDFFDIIAAEEAAIERELAALDAQLSVSALSAQVASPSSSTSTSRTSSPTLADRFDWRLTASAFRHLHLSEGRTPRHRRQASARLLRKLNSHSPQLAARIEAYQHRLTTLVELERDHERREWERVRARSLDELVAEGRAMSGLVGYWQGGTSKGKARAPKARVGVFTREGMEKLGWSRLKEGDRVELSVAAREGEEVATGPQLQDLLPKEATISNAKKQKDNAPPRPAQLFATVLAVETHRLRLLFHPPNSLVDLEACPSWRIDLAPNDAIDVKIDEAIERLAVDAAALEASDPEGKLELQGTQLSAALVGEAERAPTGSMFEQDQLIRSWYTRYARPNPLVLDGDPDLRLNPSQLRAVATMLANRISLIQGPPGTGKTHTLVAALVLLKKHFAVAAPVLLSAHTNIAVDNLCEGAMRAGLEVVRVGPSSRVEQCTLEKKMEQHPLYARLEGIRAQMAGIKRRLAALEQEGGEGQGQDYAHDPASTTSAPSLRATLSRLAQQLYLLTSRIHSSILLRADVVCSTLLSSTCAPLRCIDFPFVLVDEATQAAEGLTLLPLMKGCRQVALIGDHRQLPAVVKSREAREQGGERSLFERLIEEGETPSVMLEEQHRMHPELAAFSSQNFYEGKLRNAPSTEEIEPLALAAAGSGSRRLIFIDHLGLESVSRTSSEVSLINAHEVDLLSSLLARLGLPPSVSIGIITPYLAQARLISRRIPNVEVNTVDGFQGREKDIVLFSAVRSSEEGKVGFLADERRLNVALTRAKRGMVVLGSLAAWKAAGGVLGRFAAWVEGRGGVVRGEEIQGSG